MINTTRCGLTRCGLVILAALTIITGVTMSAFAADAADLDFGRSGSVTLTLTDSDGNTETGGEISIYEVASLYLGDGNMAYALTDEFEGCTAVLDVTDTSLPTVLAQYVKDNGITGKAEKVSDKGNVTFDGLELGLYLMVQTASSDTYETISPFVVTVPIEDDGEWDYSVDASPKVGVVTVVTTPDETTAPDDETTPAEPNLPQTGQLNWPIPVLAVGGMILFAIGWVIKNSDKDEKRR